MLIMLGQISEKVDVIFCMTENQIFQFSEVWFSGIDLNEEFIKNLKINNFQEINYSLDPKNTQDKQTRKNRAKKKKNSQNCCQI